MGRSLRFGAMWDAKGDRGRHPEHREGKNTQYEILDAVLGAFSVFFTQSPSFLAHQRDMERRKGQNNAPSLFGLQNVPVAVDRRHGDRFAPWSVTVLADDLHSHQPVCEMLLAHQLHFLMTCKSESHEALYEEVGLLEKVKGGISVQTERRWTGEYHERRTSRWVEEVPLRAGSDALKVQWCECTIVKEETGEPIYYNAWVTDHPVDENTIAEVVASGRSRWKVENEGFNVLKNLGYNFEHNFGHGSRNLSAVLLALLLLAFLFHTVLDIGSLTYRAVRHALAVRRTFFDDLRALTRYLYFPSWENLMDFMHQQLELGPSPRRERRLSAYRHRTITPSSEATRPNHAEETATRQPNAVKHRNAQGCERHPITRTAPPRPV